MKALRLLIVLACSAALATSCVAPPRGGPDPEHGLIGAFKGIGHLVLSPVQIAAGLIEGISSLPYYTAMSVGALNEGLAKAQAKITLDDTYESVYGKRLSQVGPEGDTGEVFRRMKHASEYFQKVVSRYGVPDPEHYFLTSIDTATDKGYTLFAIVYRPSSSINVIDKYDGKSMRRLTSEDRLFYEPFEKDAPGMPLDVIVDWAGIPTEYYKTQKQQAMLLTIAGNAVAEGRKRPGYWAAEKRWIDGGYLEITKEQNDKVKSALQLPPSN